MRSEHSKKKRVEFGESLGPEEWINFTFSE